MITLILIASVGLTWLLKYGSILNRPRQALVSRSRFFHDLFSCSMCLGFWSGVILGAIFYEQLGLLVVTLPLASSGLSWFCDTVIEHVQVMTFLNDTAVHINQQTLDRMTSQHEGASHTREMSPPMPPQQPPMTKGCGSCGGKAPAPPKVEDVE